MGDPKFPRRTYNTPSHPWQGERIKEEAIVVKEYGLKNKRELWKAKTQVRDLRKQSRDLQARTRTGEEQAKLEAKNLLASCARIGLLPMEGATLDDVLGLQTKSMLERRLQTIVMRKGYAITPGQARQFIIHGHVAIDDRKVTIPGYIVTRGEEDKIVINPRSPIANDTHPLRISQQEALELRAKKPKREPQFEDRRGGKFGGRGGGGFGKPKFVKKVPKEAAAAAASINAPAVPLDLPADKGAQ
jgi:small subunit ribosomal protein S4